MITGNTRINPISQPNRVKTVMKLTNGDLSITLHSGAKFEISKDDELFQTFVIYSVLAEL